MTLEDAREEARIISSLWSNPEAGAEQAAKYLHRLLSDQFNAGWDSAFDTAPDSFKPQPRKTKFKESLST